MPVTLDQPWSEHERTSLSADIETKLEFSNTPGKGEDNASISKESRITVLEKFKIDLMEIKWN